MNFSFYIARRYLLSKKSKNVVNIISAIAMLGVIVGTMALVVVLSIFNGIELLIQNFLSVFDAELKITLVEGKQFDPNNAAFEQLKNDESVVYYCEVVEEIAHFRFEDRQYIAKIKGITDDFLAMSGLDQYLYDGDLLLNDGNIDYAIIGGGVAQNLGAATNFVQPIWISVPKKGRNTSLNPFRQTHVFLSGIYAVGQQEVDEEYVLIPLDLAQNLLEMKNNVTSVELALADGTDVDKFQKKLQTLFGEKYKVQNRYQQHESYYRVTKSERFFIFLTLSFILIIASFNLASSIAMLILDKRKDIQILSGLGLTKNKIGLIFLYEGWLVTAVGAAIGLTLGVLICLGQMHYGWLKFPGSFAIENYPVELRWPNLVVIAITVLIIGAGASWLPLKLLPKRFFQVEQE
ncbi:MAG: ABC transporter permease [Prolixibacteraceae bacterium]